MGQFLGCCFDVSPNPLTKCYAVAGSNRTRLTFTWSFFNCTLLFILPDINLTVLRGVFVIRDITAGDRWPLLQKCKIAERLVFNEFDFRGCDIFSNGKDVSDKSHYTQLYIYLFLYIRMFSKNLSRNVTRYDLKKLIYIQGKDFCTLLYVVI